MGARREGVRLSASMLVAGHDDRAHKLAAGQFSMFHIGSELDSQMLGAGGGGGRRRGGPEWRDTSKVALVHAITANIRISIVRASPGPIRKHQTMHLNRSSLARSG